MISDWHKGVRVSVMVNMSVSVVISVDGPAGWSVVFKSLMLQFLFRHHNSDEYQTLPDGT